MRYSYLFRFWVIAHAAIHIAHCGPSSIKKTGHYADESLQNAETNFKKSISNAFLRTYGKTARNFWFHFWARYFG